MAKNKIIYQIGFNVDNSNLKILETEYVEEDNYLKMRNVYSIDYGDTSVFVSSSENIEFVEVKNYN